MKTRRFPRVRIILAHMGGTVSVLAPRVAVLARHMGSELTEEECMEEFGKFWGDTALGSTVGMGLWKGEKGREKVLFGTDFPGG